MIIKGGSRGSRAGYTSYLGNHLSRTDTNGRVEVLEVQSPYGHDLSAKECLTETFRDWQALCAGTLGKNGLYHVNIDPAEQYKMTPDQWWRCVEVLEKELGLEGQPRAVVLHEKHGRQHIHVVWSRTDIDTMTLRSDSHNYAAHERASLALETEFGHEHVPGKHAKRDREKQPEPPKAEFDHAEWQQAERAGIDPRVHKAALAALMAQCDSGQAFKAAVEEAGYILAQGQRRDFVAIDPHGKAHSLGRINGMRAPEMRAFMADVDRDALPTVAEAASQQRERAAQLKSADPEKPADPTQEDNSALLSLQEESALRNRLAKHYAQEREALREQQRRTRLQHEVVDEAARNRIVERPCSPPRAQELGTVAFLWRNMRELFAPELRHARQAAENERAAEYIAAQEKVRQAELVVLEQQQAAHRQQVMKHHETALLDLETRQAADLKRRLADAREAKRIAYEIERDRQRKEELRRDGPDHGPPRAG